MFTTYQPSGRFGSLAIPLWIVALVVTPFLAGLYAVLLEVIPLIYISALLTVGSGIALGWMARLVCSKGKVRSVPLGWLIGVSLVLVFIASKFLLQWLYVTQQIPGITLLQHLQLRTLQGWVINGNIPITDYFVYGIWLIEAGILFYYGGPKGADQAKEPYSEPLDEWASEEEQIMTLPITDPLMVTKIQEASSVDQLLEIPIPKTDQSMQFAIYRVNSIPGKEMEDAYLSVDQMTLQQNSSGEIEQKLKPLVRHAVLSSAQRHELAENASLLQEAMSDFRAAKNEPEPDTEPHDAEQGDSGQGTE